MPSIVNVTALVSVLSLATAGAFAQTAPARPAAPAAAAPAARPAAASPVVFAHVHLTVKDIAATRTLWVDGLKGTAVTVGTTEAVKFPGLLVFLHKGEPKGGTKGSTVSIIALEVKDLAATVKALKSAKVKLVTREETNNIYTVADDIATIPDQQTVSAAAQTPDEVSVRLIENKQAAAPIAFRHIHFAPPAVNEAIDWYARAVSAKEGNRGFGFESLDLGKQAGALMFTLAPGAVVGTDGRSLSRIGFEVRGAALLAKKIQGMGGKIVKPFGKSADIGAASVVVSDPWGTLIELTEGLKL
ncbi:MAG: VOC family protein [Vicinamibacterales bacterium]|nr:VOC family protein [Vicinamibacterales bacterium]